MRKKFESVFNGVTDGSLNLERHSDYLRRLLRNGPEENYYGLCPQQKCYYDSTKITMELTGDGYRDGYVQDMWVIFKAGASYGKRTKRIYMSLD